MGSTNISILKDTESDHDVKLSFRHWEIEWGRRAEKTMSIFSWAAQAKSISGATLSVFQFQKKQWSNNTSLVSPPTEGIKYHHLSNS